MFASRFMDQTVERIVLIDGEVIKPESFSYDGAWLTINWGAWCIGAGPVDSWHISTNTQVFHFRGWHPKPPWNGIQCVVVDEVVTQAPPVTKFVLRVLPREIAPTGN